ncbi:hypothetical protein B0H14DRAFT_2855287 [Mycena olivaceomarginata]|nr:hypothetical protein B0H14DRAFT_2855287 [Mycena olivaceomarginata]
MSCPDCFKGSVLDGEPTGVISEIDGAYFAPGPSDANSGSHRLNLKNPKILADQFALHLACDVWVPDFFAGHPPITESQMKLLPERAGVKLGFFSMLKLVSVVLPSVPSLLITNRSSVVDGRTTSFVKRLQKEKKYDKFDTVFGGGIAGRIGATTSLFDSIVLAHPSALPDETIKAIKAPTAWVQPEEAIEALYASRKGQDNFVDYEIKVYKAHGFGARPNFLLIQILRQAVDWFDKTIPDTHEVSAALH